MNEENKYWIFVTDDTHWETIKDNEIFGFNEKSIKDLDKLRVGDNIAVYIKGKKIGGLFKIISLNYSGNINFENNAYPRRIKLKKVLIPKIPINVDDEVVRNISIFRGLVRWGTVLMGRAIKQITKEDYSFIENVMLK